MARWLCRRCCNCYCHPCWLTCFASLETWELNPSTLLDPTTSSQTVRSWGNLVSQDSANDFGLIDELLATQRSHQPTIPRANARGIPPKGMLKEAPWNLKERKLYPIHQPSKMSKLEYPGWITMNHTNCTDLTSTRLAHGSWPSPGNESSSNSSLVARCSTSQQRSTCQPT